MEIIKKKGAAWLIVFIADSHKSCFHIDLMNHCDKTGMGNSSLH